MLNLDNGPENHSRRTQFMYRLTQFADTMHLTLDFAYYPPYHSKYNPIERVWGVLEQHWNGALLDSLDTVHRFAKTMTYNHVHPVVTQLTQTYPTGVKLTSQSYDGTRSSALSACLVWKRLTGGRYADHTHRSHSG